MASSSAATAAGSGAASSSQPSIDFTLEKLSTLQQLQLTLHAPRGADGVVRAPLGDPMVALDNSFPYKPILVLRWPSSGQEVRVPLSARVDLADPKQRTRLTHLPQGDGIIISMHYKKDLDEGNDNLEDAFPTPREIDAASYASLYCRCCGKPVLAARAAATSATTAVVSSAVASSTSAASASVAAPDAGALCASQSAWRVMSLPSEHWAELAELWFCHTEANMHLARLATSRIDVARGSILVARSELRVHREDLHAPEAWKEHASVRTLLKNIQANAAAAAASSSAAAIAASSTAATPAEQVWSPLPCSGPGCRAVLGSVLLSVQPSLSAEEAVRPAPVQKVRLYKHALSNCFRQTAATIALHKAWQSRYCDGAASSTQAASSADAMQVDDAEAEGERKEQPQHPVTASSTTAVADAGDSSSACLCSLYRTASVAGLRLTCSNMFLPYTLEGRVVSDLCARFEARPASRFLLDADEDEHEPAAIRLHVTHWTHQLASTVDPTEASFTATPSARSSAAMAPVLGLEYAIHPLGERGANDGHDEPLARWIAPKVKPGQAARGVVPPHVERLTLPAAELRVLLSLLPARSRLWPPSARAGAQPGMQRSCLLKLSPHVAASMPLPPVGP